MKVYRLGRKKYKLTLSGRGAAVAGNRWNSKGTEIIYTAESRSLAMAEILVHLTAATLPSDYVMLEINIPDTLSIQKINPRMLTKSWNSFPHLTATQHIGDEFISARKHAVLQVPSAVVEGDFNFLINPFHPEFDQIKISKKRDFKIDGRFF